MTVKEKEYVMCTFEILEGEREYGTKYFYPKEKYDKWTTKELLEEFFGGKLGEQFKAESYWDCDRVVGLDTTNNFKADKNKIKELLSMGIWGEE
tara:strand:- start:629 stop:910 length:282 start_codon:yes stop_codon:yes gene_type:complete